MSPSLKLKIGGVKYRIGDFVYVDSWFESDEEAGADVEGRHVALIRDIIPDSQDGDHQGDNEDGSPTLQRFARVEIAYFLFPHETRHAASTPFYQSEVILSNKVTQEDPSVIKGKCCVLSKSDFTKFRPEGFEDENTFVCMKRYNVNTTAFARLKHGPKGGNVPKLIERDEARELEPFRTSAREAKLGTSTQGGLRELETAADGVPITFVDDASIEIHIVNRCQSNVVPVQSAGSLSTSDQLASKASAATSTTTRALSTGLLARTVKTAPSSSTLSQSHTVTNRNSFEEKDTQTLQVKGVTSMWVNDDDNASENPFAIKPITAPSRTPAKRKRKSESTYVADVDDGNESTCRVCNGDGELLCCDGCPAVYHPKCLEINIDELGDGDWFCPKCAKSMDDEDDEDLKSNRRPTSMSGAGLPKDTSSASSSAKRRKQNATNAVAPGMAVNGSSSAPSTSRHHAISNVFDDDELLATEEQHQDDGTAIAADTDAYFLEHHATTSTKTSDHTLSRLGIKDIDETELRKVLERTEDEHTPARQDLFDRQVKEVPKLMIYLRQGFNLLFMGLGSKKRLIMEMMRRFVHNKYGWVCVNGYFPSLTIKQVLTMVSDKHMNMEGRPRSPIEHAQLIKQLFDDDPTGAQYQTLYLCIHNIDGLLLRNEQAQTCLSILASAKRIHLVASIDCENAVMSKDAKRLLHDITTALGKLHALR